MSKEVKDSSLGVCVEELCKKKQDRLHFCINHFEEFKFGVIRKDGTRPIDYEKKSGEYARSKK